MSAVTFGVIPQRAVSPKAPVDRACSKGPSAPAGRSSVRVAVTVGRNSRLRPGATLSNPSIFSSWLR